MAFDLLNKDGSTLTIHEISQLFGPENARPMEMFLGRIVKDTPDTVSDELTLDGFKRLVCGTDPEMSSALETFKVTLDTYWQTTRAESS